MSHDAQQGSLALVRLRQVQGWSAHSRLELKKHSPISAHLSASGTDSMSRCRARRGVEVRLLPDPDVTTSLMMTFCSMLCDRCPPQYGCTCHMALWSTSTPRQVDA